MKMVSRFLLAILSLVAVFLLAPVFGGMYKNIFGPIPGSFFSPFSPGSLESFFISLIFLISIWLGFSKKKYLYFLILVVVIILLGFASSDGPFMVFSLVLALIGWLIGVIFQFIYKKLKK